MHMRFHLLLFVDDGGANLFRMKHTLMILELIGTRAGGKDLIFVLYSNRLCNYPISTQVFFVYHR